MNNKQAIIDEAMRLQSELVRLNVEHVQTIGTYGHGSAEQADAAAKCLQAYVATKEFLTTHLSAPAGDLVMHGPSGFTFEQVLASTDLDSLIPLTPKPAPDMVSVKKQDASNYCRILSLLRMEEEGDPVAEVERLVNWVKREAPACARPLSDEQIADVWDKYTNDFLSISFKINAEGFAALAIKEFCRLNGIKLAGGE